MSIELIQKLDAPLDVAWGHLARLEDHVAWMRDARAITFTGDQRRGIGTSFTCRTQIGPLRTNDHMTVTRWREGYEIGVAHRGAVAGEGLFTLTALDDEHCELRWREELRFPWWFAGPLGAWLARPIFRALWRGNLAAFARRVSTNGPTTSS